ncbi:NAD-binding protein [Hoeflea sp. TYP-13]|uniref:NAD-binding protein n=1 Tax=Hoeflea sp. TYP-13 TaxID=3230023 RepID=UPI0034C63295
MDIEKLQRFNSAYEGEYPFLQELGSQWARSKPLEGFRILHNIPLTRETMLKLEPLYLAGAELTVTHLKLPGLAPKMECADLLREAGADIELDHDRISGEYDIALDCCAQIPSMKNVTIRRGYVELTQSGTPAYSKLNTTLPIYSLDLSKLKCLEGMFGTGEACVRAIKQFIEPELSGRKFVVFGYGKVGRGITRYLSREGAEITVVDSNPTHLEHAAATGHATERSAGSPTLLEAINDAFAVITATGHPGLVQELFSPSDISDDVHLINMGADDEFGEGFPISRVAANKAPLNFMLDSPTVMFFIDPIFAAHNRCCEHILAGGASGFTALPAALDMPVVEAWSKRYNIDVSDIHY